MEKGGGEPPTSDEKHLEGSYATSSFTMHTSLEQEKTRLKSETNKLGTPKSLNISLTNNFNTRC
jgi:hypothetical protein